MLSRRNLFGLVMPKNLFEAAKMVILAGGSFFFLFTISCLDGFNQQCVFTKQKQ